MLGFPQDFEEHFIEAWKEPFTGFELKWIEVEICRQAMIPTNVTDLFERMKTRYPDLDKMHQSKFYRIVSSLTKDGYLDDHQEGRAKIIQTTPQGAKELGRITRYFFEIQMERVKSQLWQDLIQKITTETGCLLDKQIVVLGPEYNTINTLIRECMHCPPREDNPVDGAIENYLSNFVFLDYDAFLTGKSESSTILEIKELDDWLPKDGSIDHVILFNALSVFPDKAVKILNEAQRVISDVGSVIVFESTSRDSTILSAMMQEAAILMNYTNPDSPWGLPENPPLESTVRSWIDNSDLEIATEYPDVISTIFILH